MAPLVWWLSIGRSRLAFVGPHDLLMNLKKMSTRLSVHKLAVRTFTTFQEFYVVLIIGLQLGIRMIRRSVKRCCVKIHAPLRVVRIAILDYLLDVLHYLGDELCDASDGVGLADI